MMEGTFSFSQLLFHDLKKEEICCDNDNWNEQYQRAKGLNEDNVEDKLTKYSMLNTINRNFISAASMYAKTIISELLLKDDQKSVPRCKPEEFAGYAGGMKYKWRGILFKIASGSLGPYGGSDEAAAKAMGHELKGANAYNRCNVPNLNVSLQALIDYKGFRIHAQAILEIDSDNTLKVGSADAGKTVHCRSSELQSKLKTAARNLNICKHFVKGVRLYSACDIEGHLGHDGRFYLIDLARTFPPEHPDHVEHLKMYDVGSAVLVSRGALGDDSTGLPKCENWIEGIIVNAQETQLQHGTQNNRFESFEVNTKYGIVHIRDLSSIAHCKKCIYWNFLRPEYIKHRGKAMIEAAAESKEHTFKKYTQAAECGDLELMPAENPLLQKCVSSSSTVKSSAANSRECGSEDHIYNTFFNSSESVSGQYRQNRHTLDATTSDDPRAAPSRSGPSVRSDEPEPLSSDALSEFSRDDPNRILHNLNVEIATRILIEQLIPAIARDLLTHGHPSDREGHGEGSLSLSEFMHRHGVNMRHAGLLRYHIPDISVSDATHIYADAPYIVLCGRIRAELLLQCVSRTLKNILRCIQRDWIKSQHSDVSEQAIRQILVQFLNLVSGAHSNSESFWEHQVRCGVRKRFGKLALSASEDPDVFFLDQAKGWGALGPFYIWKLSNRICDAAKHAKHAASLELLNVVELESLIPEMTENFLLTLILEICNRGGIRITEECLRQLNADNGSASYGFEFVTADIVDIVPVVKHMHQVDMAEGIVLSLAAEKRELLRLNTVIDNSTMRKSTNDNYFSHGIISRLSNLSINRLQRALRAVPDDQMACAALADVYQTLAVASSRQGYKEEAERAYKMFRNLFIAPFARCKKSGVSYKDDVLGLLLTVEYHPDNYKKGGEKQNQLRKRDQMLNTNMIMKSLSSQSAESVSSLTGTTSTTSTISQGQMMIHETSAILRHWPIKEVYVDLQCISLTAYVNYVANECHPTHEKNIRKRFLPLIIDEEHAIRALQILMEELIRMDCLKDDFYAFSCLRMDPYCSESTEVDSSILASSFDGVCRTIATENLSQQLAWKAYTAALDAMNVSSKQTRRAQISQGYSFDGFKSKLSLNVLPDSSPQLIPKKNIPSSFGRSIEEFPKLDRTGNDAIDEAQQASHNTPKQDSVYKTIVSPKLPEFDSVIGFRVISAAMNSIISQFILAAEKKIKLSSNCLFGYMAFHHMLLFFAARDPTWRATSNKIVDSFVSNPAYRHKDSTPDLGRFLVHLLLSDRGWDVHVSRAYVLECFKRQVSWYLDNQDDNKSSYGLAYLESDPVSPYRLCTTFKLTFVGLRNLMFQIYFLHSVAGRDKAILVKSAKFPLVPGQISEASNTSTRGSCSQKDASSTADADFKGFESSNVSLGPSIDLSHSLDADSSVAHGSSENTILNVYNKSLGCPTAALRKDINLEFAEILKVSTYDEFLDRIGLEGSPKEVTELLRNAVRESIRKETGSCYNRNRLYGNIHNSDKYHKCLVGKISVASLSWSDISRINEHEINDEKSHRRDLIDKQIEHEKLLKSAHNFKHTKQQEAPNWRRGFGGCQDQTMSTTPLMRNIALNANAKAFISKNQSDELKKLGSVPEPEGWVTVPGYRDQTPKTKSPAIIKPDKKGNKWVRNSSTKIEGCGALPGNSEKIFNKKRLSAP